MFFIELDLFALTTKIGFNLKGIKFYGGFFAIFDEQYFHGFTPLIESTVKNNAEKILRVH